jgi:hypothetical protein
VKSKNPKGGKKGKLCKLIGAVHKGVQYKVRKNGRNKNEKFFLNKKMNLKIQRFSPPKY